MKTIYCDGSCLRNPDGPGGWGVFYEDDEKIIKACGHESSATNNKMELMAAINAISFLSNGDFAKVYTDSQYVKKGITEWISGWKKNNWKTSDKKDVKNKELWVELDSLVQKVKVEWCWVKSHVGIEGNECADVLARRGSNGESLNIVIFKNEEDSVEVENVEQNIFNVGDVVQHSKGSRYIILSEPTLESDGSKSFEYTSLKNDDVFWIRSQKLMQENNRFELVDSVSNNELKVIFEKINSKIEELQNIQEILKKKCNHIFTKEYAHCSVCGESFGWRCSDSPDQVCHYFTENGFVLLIDGRKVKPPKEHDSRFETDDCCIYCGEPEERK